MASTHRVIYFLGPVINFAVVPAQEVLIFSPLDNHFVQLPTFLTPINIRCHSCSLFLSPRPLFKITLGYITLVKASSRPFCLAFKSVEPTECKNPRNFILQASIREHSLASFDNDLPPWGGWPNTSRSCVFMSRRERPANIISFREDNSCHNGALR